MKKRIVVAVGALLAVMCVPSAGKMLMNAYAGTSTSGATASEPAGTLQSLIQQRRGEILRELNLTSEQKRDLKSALVAERDQLRFEIKSLVTARSALRTEIQKGAEEKQIREKARAVGEAESNLAVMRARIWSKANKVLTPDQKQIIERHRAEAESQWRERFEGFLQKVPDLEGLEQ